MKKMDAKLSQTCAAEDLSPQIDTLSQWEYRLFPVQEGVDDEKTNMTEIVLEDAFYGRCLDELTGGEFDSDKNFAEYLAALPHHPSFFYNPYTKLGATVCAGVKNMPNSEVLKRVTRKTP